MEGRKRRHFRDLPAASPGLRQQLIHGGEHPSPRWQHQTLNSDVPGEPGTLVKSPNRTLAMLQTGLWAVDSRMLGCPSQAPPLDKQSPQGSGAICIPQHAHCRTASTPARLGSAPTDAVAAAHTGPFVQRLRSHEQRQRPLVLCSGPGKKDLAVPLWGWRGLLAKS